MNSININELLSFIFAHWLPSLLFIITLAAIIGLEIYNKLAGGIALITPEDLTDLINHRDGLVVDIREKAAFHQGHILGAISVDMNHLSTSEKLKSHLNSPIILVCANGQNSAKASNILKKQGAQHVYILKGGMPQWHQSNLPLIKK